MFFKYLEGRGKLSGGKWKKGWTTISKKIELGFPPMRWRGAIVEFSTATRMARGKKIDKPNTKNIKKTGDSNMTGIMTVNLPEDYNEAAREDDNASTVGVSNVTHTWSQKVKQLDDKCLFGESTRNT